MILLNSNLGNNMKKLEEILKNNPELCVSISYHENGPTWILAGYYIYDGLQLRYGNNKKFKKLLIS